MLFRFEIRSKYGCSTGGVYLNSVSDLQSVDIANFCKFTPIYDAKRVLEETSIFSRDQASWRHGALRRRFSTQARLGCARHTLTSTAGSVRLSLRAPTPTLVGRECSPAAVYTTVPAAHGTARAAPVGGSGADGGE